MLDTPRAGGWMQTYTGRQFWPLDPRPEDIDIEDIAHSLAMQSRFCGHSDKFYSVAEHSVLVSLFCATREAACAALLHDASEAYLTDVPRPLKPDLTGYKELEERLCRVIADKFGLRYPWPGVVHALDARILLDERAAILKAPPAPWACDGQGLEPLGAPIRCYSPEQAEAIFMERFNELFLGGRQ